MTTQANTAVAEGVVGAVLSEAVIQVGLLSGVAPTWTVISAAVDTDVSSTPFTASVNGGGATAWPSAAQTCAAAGTSALVIVVGLGSASATIPQALCAN